MWVSQKIQFEELVSKIDLMWINGKYRASYNGKNKLLLQAARIDVSSPTVSGDYFWNCAAPCKIQLLISVNSRCDDGLLSAPIPHPPLSLFFCLSSSLQFQFAIYFQRPPAAGFLFVLSGVDVCSTHHIDTSAKLERG